jgi:transcriptional regulator with XRE-family HTH domain
LKIYHGEKLSIHGRIKDRRVAIGLESHKALADLLGVTWQTVQLWEKEGGTAPNRKRVNAVAAALQVSPEWLVTGVHRSSSNNTVGGRLAKAMRDGGIPSQAALAQKSGVPQPTISRILSDLGEPEAATIKRLSSACQVSFNWLNEGADEPGVVSSLTTQQTEWLTLLECLGSDDINEFTKVIRARQERNKRLLSELQNLRK